MIGNTGVLISTLFTGPSANRNAGQSESITRNLTTDHCYARSRANICPLPPRYSPFPPIAPLTCNRVSVWKKHPYMRVFWQARQHIMHNNHLFARSVSFRPPPPQSMTLHPTSPADQVQIDELPRFTEEICVTCACPKLVEICIDYSQEDYAV